MDEFEFDNFLNPINFHWIEIKSSETGNMEETTPIV